MTAYSQHIYPMKLPGVKSHQDGNQESKSIRMKYYSCVVCRRLVNSALFFRREGGGEMPPLLAFALPYPPRTAVVA